MGGDTRLESVGGHLDWSQWVEVITVEDGTVDRGVAVWVGTLDWSQWVDTRLESVGGGDYP